MPLCRRGSPSYKSTSAYIFYARHVSGGDNAMFRRRFVIALAAIAAALVLVAADANARAGGGFSGGSRGMRTFSAPPVTRTAPNTAAPIQRSVIQPSKAGPVGQASGRPGFFGSGLLGGLA